MNKPLILAVDTSCDDTSAAVTSGTAVLSNVIASQTELHKPYGGVFPTVAKLAHKENIDKTIEIALQRAGVTMSQITALAVTVGPGLAPALEVGITKVKELAAQFKKPVIAVNHVEGHVLSVLAHPEQKTAHKSTQTLQKVYSRTKSDLLEKNELKPKLPVLSIIISGKQSQFILVKKLGEYEILGSTLDDAAGECLDKIGRMLNLGYPAGPVIEEFAKLGDKNKYPFPLPLTTIKTYDVSFSGMKTFARNLIEKLTTEKPLTRQEIYDFCASAQYGVFRHICYKLQKIFEDFDAKTVKHTYAGLKIPYKKTSPKSNLGFEDVPELVGSEPESAFEIKEVWLGGGVAANMELRKMLRKTLREFTTKKSLSSLRLRVPYTKKLCADNAAMIGVAAGVAGKTMLKNNEVASLERKPRLSLKNE